MKEYLLKIILMLLWIIVLSFARFLLGFQEMTMVVFAIILVEIKKK